MKPSFYYQGHHRQIATRIKDYLNSLDRFLSSESATSTRAVGDILESLVADRFDTFLGDWCVEYRNDFSRRAMEDMAFRDVEGVYSAIDVKTHREDTRFNRPNLVSVRRLAEFYESDRNVFSLVMIKYSINNTDLEVSDVLFSPIEFLDWDCLTVGALGLGQIQITNSNNIRMHEQYSRKKWMLELCDAMMEFYPREIEKIKDRLLKFEQVRERWSAKEDVWAS